MARRIKVDLDEEWLKSDTNYSHTSVGNSMVINPEWSRRFCFLSCITCGIYSQLEVRLCHVGSGGMSPPERFNAGVANYEGW